MWRRRRGHPFPRLQDGAGGVAWLTVEGDKGFRGNRPRGEVAVGRTTQLGSQREGKKLPYGHDELPTPGLEAGVGQKGRESHSAPAVQSGSGCGS